ncbi:MAG: hypothetical protein P0Y50_08825 [Candidatus Brevundimonas colombiensis]|uniref:Uncharacterized protein n=1 Tax=Candidatus Brevundimonas colombiensis TaxID=3121376 RepID=A0AAJ5X1X1_9CAUL|nr:hypothetical protein [Brevundimonas sp.]WEK38655.1 MAG: hypothetical protein P0Y50_08825 [Brevundimonas sp.]
MLPPETVLLIRANALMHTRREVLADFEAETVREAHDRVVLGRGVLSAGEARVVGDALAAMVAAPRQDLTAAGMAA